MPQTRSGRLDRICAAGFALTKIATARRCLWPHSNETFVPAAEPLISIYVSPGVFLALRTGAGGTFINNQFSNPEAAVRQCLRLFQWRGAPIEAAPAPGGELGRSWGCAEGLSARLIKSQIRGLFPAKPAMIGPPFDPVGRIFVGHR